MDIYEIAAWATIGSFLVAVAGLVRVAWRRRQKQKRPRK